MSSFQKWICSVLGRFDYCRIISVHSHNSANHYTSFVCVQSEHIYECTATSKHKHTNVWLLHNSNCNSIICCVFAFAIRILHIKSWHVLYRSEYNCSILHIHVNAATLRTIHESVFCALIWYDEMKRSIRHIRRRKVSERNRNNLEARQLNAIIFVYKFGLLRIKWVLMCIVPLLLFHFNSLYFCICTRLNANRRQLIRVLFGCSIRLVIHMKIKIHKGGVHAPG